MKLSCFCLLLFTLMSCSAQRATELDEQDVIHARFSGLVKQTPVPITAIRALAKEASSKQFNQIGWEMYLYLCQSEQTQLLKERACRTAFDLAIVNKDPTNLFNTAVFAHHHTHQEHYGKFAEKYANTQTQKAMLIIANGNIPDFSVDNLTLPDSSAAELDYLIGKKNSDVARLDRALDFFISHHIQAKIADVLFVKAKIAWVQGDHEASKLWASESALLLEQMQKNKQASFVRKWFDDRFSLR